MTLDWNYDPNKGDTEFRPNIWYDHRIETLHIGGCEVELTMEELAAMRWRLKTKRANGDLVDIRVGLKK